MLNTLAPTVFGTSGIVDVDAKPPVLCVHGAQDTVRALAAPGAPRRVFREALLAHVG